MPILLASALPWLANALFGPDGLASTAASKIGEKLGLSDKSVEAVKAAVSGMNPEELGKLKGIEDSFKLEMTKLGYSHEEQLAKIDLDQIGVINKTIQIELENSDKEAWYQKAWRPANGFAVAAGAFAGVIAVCCLGFVAIKTKDPAALNMIPALATAIAMILAVPGAAVGIAAWHRGMAQRDEIKQGEK